MINYIAHWDRILIQSRVEIINELQDYNFRVGYSLLPSHFVLPLGRHN